MTNNLDEKSEKFMQQDRKLFVERKYNVQNERKELFLLKPINQII